MTDISDSLIWELKQQPLFDALSDEELRSVIANATQMIFPARKTVFSQGEDSDAAYIILSGRIKIVLHSKSGKETVLAILGDHEMFGEMGALDGGPRSADAVALSQCRALRLSRAEILEFLTRRPETAVRVISSLVGRLRGTNEQLESLATLPAPARLAGALVRLANTHGAENAKGDIEIDLKLSQTALGATAAVTRENVNRYMKQWEADAIVSMDDGIIRVHDIDALKALVFA